MLLSWLPSFFIHSCTSETQFHILALSCLLTELQFLDILLQLGDNCPMLILLHRTLEVRPQQTATSGKPSDLIGPNISFHELETNVSIYSLKYYMS